MDLEAELVWAKGDVTTLMERVRVYEQQLVQVGETATEYQQKLAELENQMRVAAEANQNEMADVTRRSEEEREGRMGKPSKTGTNNSRQLQILGIGMTIVNWLT